MDGTILRDPNSPVQTVQNWAVRTLDQARGLTEPGQALSKLITAGSDEAKILSALQEFGRTGASLKNIFIQPRNGELDPRAMNLFRRLAFSAKNAELKLLAKQTVCEYFRQTQLSANNHSLGKKEKELYQHVADYLTAANQDSKEEAGIEAIVSSGVLFTKKGEDSSAATDINAPAKSDTDVSRIGEPLPSCYSKMQNTELGKLVYDLLASEGEGFRSLNIEVYANLLEPEPDKRLRDATALQIAAADKKLNEMGLLSEGGSIYTFRKGTFYPVSIEQANDIEREAEISFLMKNGLSKEQAQEFKFNFQDMVRGLYNAEEALSGKTSPREKAVKDFMLGYSLLHFRKSRIQASSEYSDKSIKVPKFGWKLTSSERENAVSDIDNQISLMGMIVGKDRYLDKTGALRSLFKTIVEEDVAGTIGSLGFSVMAQTEELFAGHMQAISISLNTDNYGAASPRIEVKGVTKEPKTKDEFTQYQKDLTETENTLLARIRDAAITMISPGKDGEFVDEKQINAFLEAWGKRVEAFIRTPEASKLTNLAAILEHEANGETREVLPLSANIQEEFEKFMAETTIPSVVYIKAHSDKIFRGDLQDVISFIPCKSKDSYVDSCIDRVKSGMKTEERRGSSLQVRLRSGEPSRMLRQIKMVDDNSSLNVAEQTIHSILRERSDQDERSTKNKESFLMKLLNATAEDNHSGHIDKNLTGIAELLREVNLKFAAGEIDKDTLEATREHIYVTILGLDAVAYRSDIATRTDELNQLNSLLGTESRDPSVSFKGTIYNDGISARAEHTVGAFTQICFIEAMSNSVSHMVTEAQTKAESGRDELMQGMIRTLFKDANLSIDTEDTIKALSQNFDDLSSAVAALESITDPQAKADAIKEIKKEFRETLSPIYRAVCQLTNDEKKADLWLDSLIQSSDSLDLLSYIIQLCLEQYQAFFESKSQNNVNLIQRRDTDIMRRKGDEGPGSNAV